MTDVNRRSFLITSAISCASLTFAADGFHRRRPNLVLIMADDLGYGDLSCYGAPDIQTPSIDSLAREGVRLTDYYASAPVCTPTRCALMTGRYQQRVPNLEWAIYPGVKTVGLPRSEMTIAAMLKKVGYRTAIFGKCTWATGSKIIRSGMV